MPCDLSYISLNLSGSSPQSHATRIDSNDIIMLSNWCTWDKIGSISGNKATNEGTIAEAKELSLSATETGCGH